MFSSDLNPTRVDCDGTWIIVTLTIPFKLCVVEMVVKITMIDLTAGTVPWWHDRYLSERNLNLLWPVAAMAEYELLCVRWL